MDALRTQLPWMRRVVVGSVLAQRNGPWRVVREVCHYGNGDLRSVTFAIRRCSWTGRCYTIYGYNDLRLLDYRMVPVAPRALRTAMDKRIRRAIHQPAWEKYAATCCDVEGVA